MLGARRAVRALFAALIAMLAVSFSTTSMAQVFFANTRVGTVVYKHTTVGVVAADAIAAADVSANLLAWKLCADGANTSYIAVSTGVDPDVDGVRVAAGECYECPNCTATTLKNANVKSGAAAQGYSTLQYKQQ